MDKKLIVGCGVMILKDGKILLGKRNEDPEKADSLLHGEGTWTMPGGKLHFGESFEECVTREMTEETSLKPKSIELISVTNDLRHDVQAITLGFLCRDFEGEPKLMEPEEIVEWKWFPVDKAPSPMFPPSEKILKNYLAKKFYKH